MKSFAKTALLALALIFLLGCTQPFDNPPGNGSSEKAWFYIDPIQCGNNPWEKWHDSLNRQYIRAPTQEEIITEWLGVVHGIKVEDSASKQEYDVVCEACTCARGDRIAVLVDSSHALELVKLDFVPMGNIACTEDARLCPDGTAVVREAPFCEFPEC